MESTEGNTFTAKEPFEDQQSAIKELINQYSTLESRRAPWDPIHRDIIDYIHPARKYFPQDGETTRDKTYLYNSRAVLDLRIASSGFLGYTANRRAPWYILQFDDYAVNRKPGVGKFLEEAGRILSSWFTRTSFYEALAEAAPDGLALGTGYIFSQENIGNPNKSFWLAKHPKAVFIAENPSGEVDTFCELVYTTNRALAENYGERIGEANIQRAKDRPFEGKTIRLSVFPRDRRFDQYRLHQNRPIHPRMEYTGVYWDPQENKILDVVGYWEFPLLAWRCRRDGDWYGTGPGFDVIGDTLVGNQMGRSRLQLGNLIADPPMLSSKGLEGSDDLVPGLHIYKSKETDTIEPVPLGANYPIAIDNEKRQDEIIDEHFMIPLYRMLQQATGKMTAREVIERLGEKISILGPQVGGYEKQVLQPAIRRGFNINLRAGKLPDPPQAFKDALAAGSSLKVEFVGFFSQAQKKYYQTTNISAAVEVAAGVGQFFPDSLHVIKGDDLMREGLEAAGAPASTIRDDKELAEFRDQLAAAQQAAKEEQLAMMEKEQMMKYAGNLGKAPQPGSPLDQLGAGMPPMVGGI